MKQILIVEDELAYLNLLSNQLTEKGYKVTVAMDGKQGLKKAKAQPPDLIILDIRMPVMDGMTMLELLRQDRKTKHTKVIILTNLEPDKDIIEKVVKERPLYYCVKSDIKFHELLAKVKELVAD
jgi:CheY-like chemotaxis protein